MAVPKRKTSKAQRDQRRSPNMKMKAPGLSICTQCHEPKLPNRVCPNCNYYNGKDVVESAEAGSQADLICEAERHINGKQSGIGSRYRFFMAVQADIRTRNKMILIKGGI